MFVLNFLWLLLPVAFLFGWWTGRKAAVEPKSQSIEFQSNYSKGLNYLLNEQQDEAIELFLGLSDIDQEMASTQLSLGNLFRRRGEFDRAIKIHQNLVDRSATAGKDNGDALLELANDYISSGLLDRAEQIYEKLLCHNLHVESAYESLINIYEVEQDWKRAIKLANDCLVKTGVSHQIQLAHYYCELANQLSVSDEDGKSQARKYLKKALSANPNSARANILRGDLAIQRGDFERAIECYQTVEKQNPELISEIISSLFEAYSELKNDTALRDYIKYIQSRLNPYSVIKTTRMMIKKLDGSQAADKFFKQQILKRPSLRGLRDWAQDELKRSKPEEREKVAVIVSMLDSVIKDKPGYVCTTCGFKSKALFWHCPSCFHWDTMKTIIGVEGE